MFLRILKKSPLSPDRIPPLFWYTNRAARNKKCVVQLRPGDTIRIGTTMLAKIHPLEPTDVVCFFVSRPLRIRVA